MEIFEFHFNPKLRPDLIFDSFCYEPENIYEKRVGSLYILGTLKNALPQNVRFLNRLAERIKKEYYQSTLSSYEKALRESLKEGNELLEEIARKGDVSWLGNLGFIVLSLKNFDLNFTKVGDIKIFLIRGGKLTDIEKNIQIEDIEPYPLRIFGNIVSGKLVEDDLIFVLTNEVAEFFERENLFDEILKIEGFSEKKLREFFDKRKDEILKISGICFAISLTKETAPKKSEVITPKSYPKEFHFKEFFSPVLSFFKKLNIFKKVSALKIKKPKLERPKISAFKTVKLPRLTLPKLRLSKNIITVLVLILVLALGFFISQKEEKKKLENYQAVFTEIQGKMANVEGYLTLNDPQSLSKANSLLKESFESLAPLIKISNQLPRDFRNEVIFLNDEITKKLSELNKLEEIEPELVFEFKPEKFIPQRLLVSADNLYFFSPYAKNLFRLKGNGDSEVITTEEKISLGINLNDSILFFSKPNQLIILKDGQFSRFPLKEPYVNFNLDDLTSFNLNLYFFDEGAGQIVKYPFQETFRWGEPETWLKNKIEGESIAVDGSVLILGKDNSISRFYAGELQKKMVLDVFPFAKDFSKIYTSSNLPYVFVLEPIEKRILVISKEGKIIKQFESQKFDNLLDFSISKDGKTIWLLNGLKVYKIKAF